MAELHETDQEKRRLAQALGTTVEDVEFEARVDALGQVALNEYAD